MKFNEQGRSMVEMLGVLAIIGVLSVGAIAGYSKAMMKYKLNKLTEQLTTIISATARHAGAFSQLNPFSDAGRYLIKLGEIPTEMIDKSNRIFDMFGNEITIRSPVSSFLSPSIYEYTQLTYLVDSRNPYKMDICRTFFNIAKEYQDNIYQLTNGGNPNDDTSWFYGNTYCTKDTQCIKDLTVNDINETCLKVSVGSSNGLSIYWKF